MMIVRFEMPFAMWCTNCKPHGTIIGQGVRFNAEKKKVGNYYSTPIYSFRMKHTACGGWIEIRTDPKNTAYIVTEGGRKRDTGDGAALGEGEIRIRLPGEERDKEEDPLARLEGKREDKRQAETATTRILDLQKRQSRDWEDPYEKSRKLRKAFRTERKSLERAEMNREALKDKMSLDIDVVDETDEDRLHARMVDFDNAGGVARSVRLRPMFDGMSGSDKLENRARPSKSAGLIAERKAALLDGLRGNTRAAVDPFLNDSDGLVWQPEFKKRKPASRNKPDSESRNGDNTQKSPAPSAPIEEAQTGKNVPGAPVALVDYASDSE